MTHAVAPRRSVAMFKSGPSAESQCNATANRNGATDMNIAKSPTTRSLSAAAFDTREDREVQPKGAVKRRSFLKGVGMAGAAGAPLAAGSLLLAGGKAVQGGGSGKLYPGEAATPGVLAAAGGF